MKLTDAKELSAKHPIIFFDGVCNLCNDSIQKIIKYDKNELYRFSSLQSNLGVQVTEHFKLAKVDSILLLSKGKVYAESRAALNIIVSLGGLFSLVSIFKLIPTFIADAVYRWVAKNRYRWFGRMEHCMIPTKELKKLFIEE